VAPAPFCRQRGRPQVVGEPQIIDQGSKKSRNSIDPLGRADGEQALSTALPRLIDASTLRVAFGSVAGLAVGQAKSIGVGT